MVFSVPLSAVSRSKVQEDLLFLEYAQISADQYFLLFPSVKKSLHAKKQYILAFVVSFSNTSDPSLSLQHYVKSIFCVMDYVD